MQPSKETAQQSEPCGGNEREQSYSYARFQRSGLHVSVALKAELRQGNDHHQHVILDNGDILNSHTREWLGILFDDLFKVRSTTVYDVVKEHDCKTGITFRFIGDLLSVEAISNAIGIRPTRSFEKGEPYVGAERSGGEIIAVRRVRPRGIWQLSTDTHVLSEQICDHAIWLIDRLEPKAEDIARLKETNMLFTRVSVRFVGSGGFSLPSSLVCRLAGLCEEIMVTCWDDESP